MKLSVRLFACAGVIVCLSTADAKQVQVKDARGNTITMQKSRSFGECVRRSVKLGHPKDGAERYCARYFKR